MKIYQQFLDKAAANLRINEIVSKLKDEVKPMFIFNAKYRKNDSIDSIPNSDIMTPSFDKGIRV